MNHRVPAAKISLRPFHRDGDWILLENWVHAPHVRQWWGDPDRALAEIRAAAEEGGEFLVFRDDAPVGYLRWQIPARAELHAAGLDEIPADAIDIDIAIGDPDSIGCGVGSRALLLLSQRLSKETNSSLLMLGTSTENLRAVRAFEKVGFRRVREFQDPEFGAMWLMTLSTRELREPSTL